MAFPKRSDRRGSGSCGKRASNREAPRLFFASASYEQLVPCRCIGPRRSSLRLYASCLRPEASMLSSSASAPSCVSSFANT